MERSSRWRSINPMEWLKAIYETFGTPYPRASLIAVMLLCAIVGGAAWLVLARQVDKSKANTDLVPSVNTTNGAQSPIMPNNGAPVTISNDNSKSKQPPPK